MSCRNFQAFILYIKHTKTKCLLKTISQKTKFLNFVYKDSEVFKFLNWQKLTLTIFSKIKAIKLKYLIRKKISAYCDTQKNYILFF